MGARRVPSLLGALRVISVLLFVVGLVSLALIPVRPLVAQGVYLDEHAFLPHQGTPPEVRPDDVDAIDTHLAHCWQTAIPAARCLAQLMEQFGLDATTTEYGFSQAPAYAQAEWRVADAALYPFASASQPALTVVAGRWRASKSDGTHTLALVAEAPFWGVSEPSAGGVPSSVAVALTAVRAAIAHSFLAKDVLVTIALNPAHDVLRANLSLASPAASAAFPFTRFLAAGRALAVAAIACWVDDYTAPAGAAAFALPRAGTVTAVLALDVPGAFPPPACVSELSLSALGPQGLLPNLDIVSATFSAFPTRVLVAEPMLQAAAAGTWPPLSARAGPAAARLFSAPAEPWLQAAEAGLWAAWRALWTAAGRAAPTEHGLGTARFMAHQALDATTALHAPWVGHAVDAVSVAAVYPAAAADVEARLTAAARGRPAGALACAQRPLLRALVAGSVEWLRMMSNAHEKLHHSTWLYLLSSSANFTTMARYVYAFAALAAPLALWALYALLASPVLRLLQALAATLAAATLGLLAFLAAPTALAAAGHWPATGDAALAAFLLLTLSFAVLAPATAARASAAVARASVGQPVTAAVTRVPWDTVHALLGGLAFLPLLPLVIANFSATVSWSAVLTALFLGTRLAPTRARALCQLPLLVLLSPFALVFAATLVLRAFAPEPSFVGACLWPTATAGPGAWGHAAATVETLKCLSLAAPRAAASPLPLIGLSLYLPFWALTLARTVAGLLGAPASARPAKAKAD